MAHDDAPVDHKGRSRPIYERRSGQQQPLRTSRWARLLLGIFPGLRFMAGHDGTRGFPFMILGLLVLGACITLVSLWSVTRDQLDRIGGAPALMLLHAGLIGLLLLAFEALRLATAFPDRTRSTVRTPRFIAFGFLPSAAVVLAAPTLTPLAPRLMEAFVAASGVILLGSLPAMAASGLQPLIPPSDTRRRWMMAAALTYTGIVAMGLLWAVALPHPEWAARLERAGLVVMASWVR
ncbi:MAG: hypothetical protein ACFB9M_13575 [Myxococcota bacterium]